MIINEINGELSKEDIKILDILRNNKNAVKQDIISDTGVSSRTIDRIIKTLKEKVQKQHINHYKTL